MNSVLSVQCQVRQTTASIDDEEGYIDWRSDRRESAAKVEAVVSDSRAEVIAGRAHRLYVFGVIFSSLFLLGFLLTAIFASDFQRPIARPPLIEMSPSADKLETAGRARDAALEKIQAAQRTVGRSRDQLSAAEIALFRFLFDHLSDASPSVTTPREDVQANPSLPARTTDLAVAENPQLAELERELSEARERKKALLERMTPSHPTMQSLDSSIAALESQVEAARKMKVIEPSRVVAQLPPIAVQRDTNESNHSAAMDQARELMVAAGRAQRNYEAAVAKETSSWVTYNHLPCVVSLGAAPAAVRPFGPLSQQPTSPMPVIGLAGLLVLAIACGIAAARNARRRLPAFASTEEVVARLGIPVLGRLASAGSSPSSFTLKSPDEPRWLRRWVTLSEVVLALAIGSAVLLAITNFPMLQQIANDPLAGISQCIAKMRGLAGK
jgi:hypothetical protein